MLSDQGCWVLQKVNRIIVLVFLLFISQSVSAFGFIDGITGAIGGGRPNTLIGTRWSFIKHWNVRWVPSAGWSLGGYWDANIAYLHCFGNNGESHRNIFAFGLNPVFRLQKETPFAIGITPFFEASVGVAGLSEKYMGKRSLGAKWSFEDLLGFGFSFGQRRNYDLSFHYLHYSNANICPPNNGIDVKLLVTLTYHFCDGLV